MRTRRASGSVRSAIAPQADRDLAREVVLAVLRAESAEVVESTHSHVRFVGWNPKGEHAFARAGYVGLHAHAGETEVGLRVLASARLPRRAFLWTSVLAAVAAVLLFALQPTPVVWVIAALVLWPPWIAAAVVRLGARRVDRELEDALYARIVEALRERGVTVLTEAEVRRRDFEMDVEGEIAEKRLKGSRSAKR